MVALPATSAAATAVTVGMTKTIVLLMFFLTPAGEIEVHFDQTFATEQECLAAFDAAVRKAAEIVEPGEISFLCVHTNLKPKPVI